MKKGDIIKALALLLVPEAEYKDLAQPQLLELLNQKKAEKALADAELGGAGGEGTDDEGADDEGADDEGADDEGADDEGADDEGDGAGNSEINTGDVAVRLDAALQNLSENNGENDAEQTSAGDSDRESELGNGLTKLKSKGCRFHVLGVVVIDGVTKRRGTEVFAPSGKTFYADDETAEHLIGYRVADKD